MDKVSCRQASALGGSADLFAQRLPLGEATGEIRMGKALRDRYRDKVFLMTKIDGRSKKEAARQLDESLQRLQVDCIDLVQHHEIIRYVSVIPITVDISNNECRDVMCNVSTLRSHSVHLL